MNIRQANSSDSLLLSSLCMDVQRLHAENHPDIFKLPQSDDFAVSFFEEMLANPMTRIFIAEENGEAVGHVFCQLMERPEGPFTYARRVLHIDQISVRPATQGQGVGAALIERAVSLGKEMSVSKIQLDSWGFNTGAHAFFEKLGFEKFNHRFWRIL
jgi:ribosomal protein S18 acetylase RimI-like enzyme